MAVRATLAMPKREEPVEPEKPKAAGGRARAREGRRAAMVWLDPAAVRQLNQIALDEDSTVQALMVEALGALFVSRGKPRLT
ncbi:MAG: ribbon-helix-helix domain-containing protein [Janthinobacterium lividum]